MIKTRRQKPNDEVDLEYMDQWEEIREKMRVKGAEKLAEERKVLDKLLTSGKLDAMAWAKVNGILRLKRKISVWSGGKNRDKVANGWKTLYKHGGPKVWTQNDAMTLLNNHISKVGANEFYLSARTCILLEAELLIGMVLDKGK